LNIQRYVSQNFILLCLSSYLSYWTTWILYNNMCQLSFNVVWMSFLFIFNVSDSFLVKWWGLCWIIVLLEGYLLLLYILLKSLWAWITEVDFKYNPILHFIDISPLHHLSQTLQMFFIIWNNKNINIIFFF
jgi:hypothetical protein